MDMSTQLRHNSPAHMSVRIARKGIFRPIRHVAGEGI